MDLSTRDCMLRNNGFHETVKGRTKSKSQVPGDYELLNL